MKTYLIALFVAGFSVAGSAQAMTAKDLAQCQALGKTLPAKQVEIKAASEKRDSLAEQVETLGLAWDDVEVHRMVSAAHAEQADEAKATYTKAKTDLLEIETALQADLDAFNTDVAAYNARCVAKKK